METAAAWDALNAKNYETAMERAGVCIREFREVALKIQSELEGKRASVPDESVDEKQKQAIFQNGPLNDVATCYFIKGSAAEHLGKIGDAKTAYKLAMRLSFARTWDPQGWFWSPGNAAAEHLRALQ